MNKPVESLPAEKLEYLKRRTDKYFSKSRQIVEKFGDRTVTYGVFLRRGVICAVNPAICVLRSYYSAKDVDCGVDGADHAAAQEHAVGDRPVAELLDDLPRFAEVLVGAALEVFELLGRQGFNGFVHSATSASGTILAARSANMAKRFGAC